jgi:hypothetical protein
MPYQLAVLVMSPYKQASVAYIMRLCQMQRPECAWHHTRDSQHVLSATRHRNDDLVGQRADGRRQPQHLVAVGVA